MAETLGVPYSSEQAWREELARERDDNFAVVACVQGEVVGHLALSVYMNPRTRHSGHFGIAVRDDWQGRGVGTALMEVCLDLADNGLSLTRLDLRVYTDNAPAIALYKKFGFEIGELTDDSHFATANTWMPTSWPVCGQIAILRHRA
jgi:putative acetyltransferase